MVTAETKEAPFRHTIEKNRADLSSIKVQMVLAGLIIIASCCLVYGDTLKLGFLLDDYLHVDYAARALAGDPAPLLNNFVSNWGGSDIMKSYRPVISLSIFVDYLLYHNHAAGYHLTNLLIFCACSLLVALVTLEITGRLGSRSGVLAALWAGLLFSVYPLHAESVAWIIGRVDTLASAFYLASLLCFLRFDLVREKVLLWRALAFFLLALTSKEIAVSLPAAIFLLACLPPGRLELPPAGPVAAGGWSRLAATIKHAALASLPFLIVLILYALARQMLLGTTIGGYGDAGVGSILRSLKIFADKDSLIKIFVPVSEEYLPVRTLALCCIAPAALAAISFLLRQLGQYGRNKLNIASAAAPLAALLWLAVALVPAFQIWHIYPNLVGSRLFFLSSAGYCIVLSLLALPIAEILPAKAFTWCIRVGIAALAALYMVWFNALQINLTAWQQASRLVESFQSQLRVVALAQNNEAPVVILNLPQDYKGAGMIGRKLYLDISNSPPFIGADLSRRLTVLEPQITGSRDYIWPADLARAIASAGEANVFIWSNKDGALKHFNSSAIAAQTPGPENKERRDLSKSLEAELSMLPGMAGGTWQAVDTNTPLIRRSGPADNPWCEITSAAIYTGDRTSKKPVIKIKLPGKVDPIRPDNWLLSLDVEDERAYGMTSQCQVIWYNQDDSQPLGQANAYLDGPRGRYLFDLGRYRTYLLNQNPLQLELQFTPSEGGLRFRPTSLKLSGEKEDTPTLSLDAKADQISWDAADAIKNKDGKIFSEIRFYVTKPGITVDPNTEIDLYRPAAIESLAPALKLPVSEDSYRGSLTVAGLLRGLAPIEPGPGKSNRLRQIVAVLASKDGKTLSLPSRPVTINR